MRITDAHCHISPVWYEPVEELVHKMDENGVEQAVLVQFMGQLNNDYQFSCVASFPGRFANVVLVDSQREDALAVLETFAQRGARGVRLRPDSRSPGKDSLAIWRHSELLGLTVSCSGTAAEFAGHEFSAVVEEVPSLPIVLEHLGGENHPNPDENMEIRRRVFELSRYANVYLKFHGLGEFALRPRLFSESLTFVEPIPPHLELAWEAFGPGRLMWGSDFPPVSAREGYANALRGTLAYLDSKKDSEKQLVFGEVARRLFGLGERR